MYLTADKPLASSLHASITVAPRSVNVLAVSFPIPVFDPVIITILLVRFVEWYNVKGDMD